VNGQRVNSFILDIVKENLPKASSVTMFHKDVDCLTSDWINAVKSYGYVTNGVFGESSKGNHYISFTRIPMTASGLARK
jgi:hypothetical protein